MWYNMYSFQVGKAQPRTGMRRTHAPGGPGERTREMLNNRKIFGGGTEPYLTPEMEVIELGNDDAVVTSICTNVCAAVGGGCGSYIILGCPSDDNPPIINCPLLGQ